jgi:hypothetical protein
MDTVHMLLMPLQALCTCGPYTGCLFNDDSTVPTSKILTDTALVFCMSECRCEKFYEVEIAFYSMMFMWSFLKISQSLIHLIHVYNWIGGEGVCYFWTLWMIMCMCVYIYICLLASHWHHSSMFQDLKWVLCYFTCYSCLCIRDLECCSVFCVVGT